MNNFNDFLISSIDLSGDVASKSTMISNVVWKYFSDFTKACLIAGNLADLSLDKFFGRINQDEAPKDLLNLDIFTESVETTIWFGLYEMLLSLLNFLQIASFRSK